jgi:hypothetical protein
MLSRHCAPPLVITDDQRRDLESIAGSPSLPHRADTPTIARCASLPANLVLRPLVAAFGRPGSIRGGVLSRSMMVM